VRSIVAGSVAGLLFLFGQAVNCADEKSGRDQFPDKADYERAKAECDRLAGAERDRCMTERRGREADPSMRCNGMKEEDRKACLNDRQG
jgi:hypothetical protein